MNIKLIVVAILAIIIGIGSAVYVASQNGEESGTETTTEQQPAGPLGDGQQTVPSVEADHEVVYTDEGYFPDEITIQAGESVAFINESSRDVWTASDPHPSHTDLPEFDALQAESPGTVYTYTFEQPGEWGYHNHLSSAQSGVVIVE